MTELNKIIHADCMDIMKDIPDKYFELAIVDPPYGINWTKSINYTSEDRIKKQKARNYKIHIPKDWDSKRPNKKYFKELFRISNNQIICGGNYFSDMLPISRGWVVWDKKNPNFTCINNELIWTSFKTKIKIFSKSSGDYSGVHNDANHIHPTMKPVALIKWLLKNYAKTGDKIIDTHSGSGTTAVACIDMGYDYLCIEKDKDYFDASVKRIGKELIKIKMAI